MIYSYNQILPLLKKEKLRREYSFKRIFFTDPLLNDFYVYQMSAEVHGQICPGLGVDRSRPLAIIKAIFEYYERLAFMEHGASKEMTSTNGMAAHLIKEKALITAQEELMERDAILMHWYSQIPFRAVPAEQTLFLNKYKEYLKAKKLKALFRKTTLGLKEAHLCFLINERGGFTLGLSSKDVAHDAIEKAFSEALINEFFGQGSLSSEVMDQDIREGKLISLLHHRYFWKEKAVIPSWVLENGEDLKEEVDEKFHQELAIKYGPIWCVKVSSEPLLELGLGVPEPDLLAKVEKRLQKLNLELKIKSPIELIHPIP